MTFYYSLTHSPLGWILLATAHNQLCWLSLGDCASTIEQSFLQQFPHYTGKRQRLPTSYQEALEDYFVNDRLQNLAISPQGTTWQKRVWHALTHIPWGQTWTYSELAHYLGSPRSVRAVASACAKNPIALFIPCHRVIAKSGALQGYHWGIEHKAWLLEHEKRSCSGG